MNSPSAEPRCFACTHFFVTYDPTAPRGCRWFGFKGPEMPSVVVLRESGQRCGAFTLKPEKKPVQ